MCNSSVYVFNSTTKGCNIDCSLINYTRGLATSSVSTCNCVSGFVWDAINKTCKIVCNSSINYSTTIVTGTVDQCNCQSIFYWKNL